MSTITTSTIDMKSTSKNPISGQTGGGSTESNESNYVSAKSANRNYGAKKNGGGGRYTWGRAGALDDGTGPRALDENDPNYDSAEEEMNRMIGRSKRKHRKAGKSANGNASKPAAVDAAAASSDDDALAVFKDRCRDLLKEFFVGRDVGEAAEALQELGERDFHGQFVELVLREGLEKKPGDRELASYLLSSLYGLIVDYQYVSGFTGALNRADDLVLDNPDTADALGKFIARAIADELLAPSFVQRTHADPGSVAEQALQKAASLLAERKPALLYDVWENGGATVSVAELKKNMVELAKEYLSSVDPDEAAQALRDLDSPAFHFQFVKIAIREALDAVSDQALTRTVDLFNKLHQENLLSLGSLLSGSRCVINSVADLTKDVSPNCVGPLTSLLDQLAQSGLIPLSLPTAAREAIPELLKLDKEEQEKEAAAAAAAAAAK